MDNSFKRLLPSVWLILASAGLVLLAFLYPSLFGEVVGMGYVGIALASWAIWSPLTRPLMHKLARFALSLAIALVCAAYVKRAGLSTWTFGLYWFSLWFVLVTGIGLVISYSGTTFGMVFSGSAMERPAAEPERTSWLWKETAYVGFVMRPLGEFLFFFIAAAFRCFPISRQQLHDWQGFDATRVMFLALLFPLASLLFWVLSWKPEMSRALLRKALLPAGVRRQLVAALAVSCALGAYFQLFRPGPNDIASWVAFLPLLLLSAIVVRLAWLAPGGEESVSSHSTLPKLKPFEVAVRVVVMLSILNMYDSLLHASLTHLP